MYELFLLGKLMERSWHGYDFQRALSSALGPARQVSWGAIYPLLRRMEKTGLIEPVPNGEETKDRRGRQHYAITPSGRDRFLELMQKEHLNDADYRDVFRIRVGNFNRVPVEVRRSIMKHYLALLAEISAHTQAMSERVSKLPEMGDAERICILLALGHDHFLAEADGKWVQEQMTTSSSRASVLQSRWD